MQKQLMYVLVHSLLKCMNPVPNGTKFYSKLDVLHTIAKRFPELCRGLTFTFRSSA